jgi:hypothetical protein
MNTAADFKAGQRVALHPATDLWMQGARYGMVVSVNVARSIVSVQVDGLNRARKIHPSNLLHV